MLLRASGERRGNKLNIGAIAKHDGRGSGVPHGDALVALVNAALGDDASALAAARQEVVDALGMAALADSAATIATFTIQNRVANATGLPLDPVVEMASRTLRSDLGVESFGTASHTSTGGWATALAARIMAPLAPLFLRLAGRLAGRDR